MIGLWLFIYLSYFQAKYLQATLATAQARKLRSQYLLAS